MFSAFQRLTFFRNKMDQILAANPWKLSEKNLENEERKETLKSHKNSFWKENFCSCVTKSTVSQLLKGKCMEVKGRNLKMHWTSLLQEKYSSRKHNFSEPTLIGTKPSPKELFRLMSKSKCISKLACTTCINPLPQ